MSVNEVIDEIVERCKKYNVQKVVLYGSRAKGTALERSDIEIYGRKIYEAILSLSKNH